MSIAEQILEERRPDRREEERLSLIGQKQRFNTYVQALLEASRDASEANVERLLDARATAEVADDDFIAHSAVTEAFVEYERKIAGAQAAAEEFAAAHENLKATEKRHKEELRAARQREIAASGRRSTIAEASLKVSRLCQQFPDILVMAGTRYYLKNSPAAEAALAALNREQDKADRANVERLQGQFNQAQEEVAQAQAELDKAKVAAPGVSIGRNPTRLENAQKRVQHAREQLEVVRTALQKAGATPPPSESPADTSPRVEDSPAPVARPAGRGKIIDPKIPHFEPPTAGELAADSAEKNHETAPPAKSRGRR